MLDHTTWLGGGVDEIIPIGVRLMFLFTVQLIDWLGEYTIGNTAKCNPNATCAVVVLYSLWHVWVGICVVVVVNINHIFYGTKSIITPTKS